MRIPSASTNRYISFVAVDATDFVTRETGYGTTGWTVYYYLDDGSATAMTTPTVAEPDSTNMPGVYRLLIDESGMTTLDSGKDTMELTLHITHTGMAPVTRVVEVYRPETTEGNALGVASAGTLTSFAHDTGVADTVWKYSARALTSFAFDTGIWGSNAGRTLTSFALDTGVADTVWKYSTSGATADTGSTGYAQGRLMAVKGDTGAAHLDAGRLGVSATATVDTGEVSDAVWGKRTPGDSTRYLTGSANIDTGVADTVWKYSSRVLTSFGFDTGIWGSNAARTLTSFGFDTGVADTVWKASTSTYTGDTGSVGYAQGRLMAVKGDTGAAHLDAGRLGVGATATVDTGEVSDAVWGKRTPGDSTRYLTGSANVDTGVADTVWKYATRTVTAATNITSDAAAINTTAGVVDNVTTVGSVTGAVGSVTGAVGSVTLLSANSVDTGSFTGTAAKANDTGAFVNSIWGATTRILTSFGFDTGIAQTVWRASTSTYTGDTGSVAYAQGRLMAVKGDTGAAHVSAGRLGVDVASLSDTGILDRLAELDTGVAGIVRNLLDAAEIDGLKVIEAMRLWTSVLGGVVNGAGSGTEVFSEINDTGVARVTATVTAAGNRTAITLALDT